MNIHQMQLSYSTQEDRIIMQFNSRENQEIQLFLTRRMVIAFWNILNKTVNYTLANKPKFNDIQQAPVEPLSNTKQETTSKQMKQPIQNPTSHQNINNKNDDKTPFHKADSLPMKEIPILVEKITIDTYDNSSIVLNFTSTQGHDINLNLNAQILHDLSTLLMKILPATDWNIDLMNTTSVIIDEEKGSTLLH